MLGILLLFVFGFMFVGLFFLILYIFFGTTGLIAAGVIFVAIFMVVMYEIYENMLKINRRRPLDSMNLLERLIREKKRR